jgi:KaiC/GvpD/RAD55 family RecA-like ATPase
MVKSELIERSPLRVFENSIHGGLGSGRVGVLASRKGVGKTACLVHIATDQLFRDKHVIHVSFSTRVDHIVGWYEDIFKEISRKRELENALTIHDEIIKNRVIMNFNQEGVDTDQILRSISAMISDGNFAADSLLFDGYDFAEADPEDVEKVKKFAEERNLEVWFSASLRSEEPCFDEKGFPVELDAYRSIFDVIITLAYEGDHVRMKAVKDRASTELHDMHLKLDPKTMLIALE